MKNKYLEKSTYGGMDWHDCYQTSEFLKQNNRYEIQNATDAIASEVKDLLDNMYTEVDGKVEAKLINIPSLEDIRSMIAGKQEFEVISDEDRQLEASWNPEKNKLVQSYGFGQVNFYTTFYEYDIEPENVVYVVVENFLCPTKGVPSIQRFYQKPFDTLSDAEKALKDMKTHVEEPYQNSVDKELLIIDKNRLPENPWYQKNMAIIEILEQHPELDTQENFKCFIDPHLETLQAKIA